MSAQLSHSEPAVIGMHETVRVTSVSLFAPVPRDEHIGSVVGIDTLGRPVIVCDDGMTVVGDPRHYTVTPVTRIEGAPGRTTGRWVVRSVSRGVLGRVWIAAPEVDPNAPDFETARSAAAEAEAHFLQGPHHPQAFESALVYAVRRARENLR